MNVHTIRLDFDAPDEATFLLDLRNEPEPRLTGVGLDGLFRNSITGQTVIARGNWLDDETFIDYSEGPGLSNYVMKLYFVGDQVEFEINIPGLAGHPIVGTEG